MTINIFTCWSDIFIINYLKNKLTLTINIMKKIILSFVMAVIALLSFDGYARNITVSFKNEKAEKVIEVLKKETGYRFAYRKDVVNGVKTPITCSFNNVDVNKVIDEVIVGKMGLSYEISEDTVVIRKPQGGKGAKVTIIGSVLDESGEPLIGATVMVANSAIGTATNLDGQFSLSNVPSNGVLNISYVGYNPQRISIAGRRSFDITLEPIQRNLSEVVVTGYQTLKRENATGSFQKITDEQLQNRYTGDLSSNLEGMVPGLVQYDNGVTNQLAIRGTSSLSASTTPLIVINGMPIEGSIDEVNPNDIKSITVLKDAAAAAIYGARASNGVIVITTRQASDQQIEVDFSANFTVAQKPSYKNKGWMSAAEELELNEYNFNYIKNNPNAWQSIIDNYTEHPYQNSPIMRLMIGHELGTVSDSQYAARINSWSKNDYRSEWRDLNERNRFIQQYNLGVRASGKYLNSSLSLNYKADNEGTPDEYDRTLRFNYSGNLKFTKWFDVNFGIYIEHNNNKSRTGDKFGLLGMNSFRQYQTMSSTDPDDAGISGVVDLREPELDNPNLKPEAFSVVDEVRQNYLKSKGTLLRPFAAIVLHPLEGLDLSAQFQYEGYSSKSEGYLNPDSYTIRHLYNLYTYKGKHYMPEGGLLDLANDNSNDYTFRLQANYDRTFADKHRIDVAAGFEYRENKFRSTSQEIVGYDDQSQTNTIQMTNLYDAYQLRNCDLGESYSPVGYRFGDADTRDILHRFYSYYFTGNYTYDRRYSVSGSYRVDKADLFGADPKFRGRPLWSVGLSWNINNEDWMRDYTWLDMLKLRASYGLTGNINSSVSSYLTATIRTDRIYGGKKAILNTPPNDQLRWEKTKTWNAGIDFAFLNYGISGSFDWYVKNGSDILSKTDIDTSTGWSSLTINNASIRNKGFELQINAEAIRQIERKDFGLDFAFNLACNDNKVTAIDHEITSGYEALSSSTYHLNSPIHSLYSMKYAGMAIDDSGTQQVYFQKADGTKMSCATFDDELEPADVIYSGNLDPKITMSLTPTLKWNGFSLSALMVFYGGHYMRTNADRWTIIQGTEYSSPLPRCLLDYWRAEGDNKLNYLPNGYAAHGMDMYDDDPVNMDINVAHADFLKMRSLMLSYQFGPSVLKAIHAKGLRIGFQMNNVFCWARNGRSLDPESVDAFSGSILTSVPKSYVMSINLNF